MTVKVALYYKDIWKRDGTSYLKTLRYVSEYDLGKELALQSYPWQKMRLGFCIKTKSAGKVLYDTYLRKGSSEKDRTIKIYKSFRDASDLLNHWRLYDIRGV